MRVNLRIPVILIAMWSLADCASACSCSPGPRSDIDLIQEVCGSRSIFVGTGLSSRLVDRMFFSHTLTVEQLIKGDASGLERTIPGQGSMCHMQFEESQRYIVFAFYPEGSDEFVSSKCGFSHHNPSEEFLEKVEAIVNRGDEACDVNFEELREQERADQYLELIEETEKLLADDD